MTFAGVSANLDLLFAEGDVPFDERVRRAAAAGVETVELWLWSDKQLDAIAEAVRDTGVGVAMSIVEPELQIVDPATHEEFARRVEASALAAARIGARGLAVVSGDQLEGVDPAEHDAAIVAALRLGAPIAAAHGVQLWLEPLNSLIDHQGTYLSGTTTGLDVVEQVDHPAVRLLYDVYHSAVMGEHVEAVLAGRGELIGHVHVADTDGRHEPGTGTVDWALAMAAVATTGYTGSIGLEYEPTMESAASVAATRSVLRL